MGDWQETYMKYIVKHIQENNMRRNYVVNYIILLKENI